MGKSATSMQASLLWVTKATFSHYWRHPWQTLFLLVGLVAGVGLWSAVQIINQQARLSYAQADSLLGVQANHWIRSRDDNGISTELYIQLRRAGFRQVFPIVEAQVSTAQGVPIRLIATDLFALPNNLFEDDNNAATGSADGWLEFVKPPYRVWVPPALAQELGLQSGERLVLRDGRQLPPALIQSREQQGRQVFMDIGAAFELLQNRRFSYLALGEMEEKRLAELTNFLPQTLELVENHQRLDLNQLTESLHTHLTAMSLLSFAVGLFIVFNAVRFSLWYRRPTFLNLRLMGVSGRLLIIAVIVETLLWSFMGAGMGMVIGMQIGQWLLPGLGASLQSLYDATVDTHLNWQFGTLVKAWVMTLGGLFWALAWPLYQQLKRNSLPSNVVSRAATDDRRSRVLLAKTSLLLLLAAAIVYPNLKDAFSGFLLLGLLLFAAAWILPMLLALTLKLISSQLSGAGLLSRWLISDGWAQMPAFRSAMMALMLAMTANLGVGTLVDSFRNAFINWLDVRQSADIYIRSSGLDIEGLLDPASSSAWLADSHQRIGVTTRWRERQTLVRGVDTDAPDSRRMPLAQWLGESPEKTLAQWRSDSSNILANEQAHYLGGLQLGDEIELQSDRGARQYRVIGFFYDYGNPYYQFFIDYDEAASHWQHHRSRGIALWLKSNQSSPSTRLAETAIRAAGAKTGDWISQTQVRKLSLNIFERTFAITSAMNALTMIVAAIALLASLLAILQERLPQFAQWRSLGLRFSEQLGIIAAPLLIFVVVAWLLAIPLGALLSWILIYKLNIVSFGWSMPMLWEMAPAWRLGGIILCVVMMTLVLAAWQLRRRLSSALAQLGELT